MEKQHLIVTTALAVGVAVGAVLNNVIPQAEAQGLYGDGAISVSATSFCMDDKCFIAVARETTMTICKMESSSNDPKCRLKVL